MRNITIESVNAFNENRNFKKSNTEVFYSKNQESTYLSLFGNTIATKFKNKLMISNCGWFTPTTKERLNGLPNVSIQQKNFAWYLNGKEWNGNLIEIKI
tara:strand:- start:472 stop:768 length:297 start_codon:yes stop_codon:yes gene_type:complete